MYVFTPSVVQVGAVVTTPASISWPSAATGFCATITVPQAEQCDPAVKPVVVQVADVIMSVASESYDGKKMYYAEPILLFADGSKFAFDEYFTERAFGNLVERIEELAEQMDDML